MLHRRCYQSRLAATSYNELAWWRRRYNVMRRSENAPERYNACLDRKLFPMMDLDLADVVYRRCPGNTTKYLRDPQAVRG